MFADTEDALIFFITKQNAQYSSWHLIYRSDCHSHQMQLQVRTLPHQPISMHALGCLVAYHKDSSFIGLLQIVADGLRGRGVSGSATWALVRTRHRRSTCVIVMLEVRMNDSIFFSVALCIMLVKYELYVWLVIVQCPITISIHPSIVSTKS